MPTYDYSGEVTLKLEGLLALPGKRIETNKYYSDTDLNLVSHLPQVSPPPVKTLFNEDIVAGVVSSVEVDQNYDRIAIFNESGGVCKIYTNNDPDNIIPMVDESFWILDNRERTIGEIYMSGESSGGVKISLDKNIL